MPGRPYSLEEERKIFKIIVDADLFTSVKTDSLWKETMAKKIEGRTWQSLKNHFRRHMIRNMHPGLHGLTKEEINKFRDVYADKVQRKKPKKEETDNSFDLNQLTSSSEDELENISKNKNLKNSKKIKSLTSDLNNVPRSEETRHSFNLNDLTSSSDDE